MNAAVVESFDRPPRYTTFADPAPSADETLVTVAAAGLHPIVRSLAAGRHYGSTGQPPFIPGVDGVGRLPSGARVLCGGARFPFGTFAEHVVIRSAMALPLPDAIDDVTAAALMNPGMSSWGALRERAHFVAGESVLILGATGCAGRLAVQITKRFGASRIVAIGRDSQALEETLSLGADATLTLAQDRDTLIQAFRTELAEHPVDVVLDYLWGTPAEALLAALTQRGLSHASRRIRYIQIGSMAAPTIALPAEALRSSGLELLGSGFGSVPIAKIFECIVDLLAEAARRPFTLPVTAAPLRDVEKLWNQKTHARLVFQP